MKRVNKDFIAVDNENNSVAFLNSQSLAVVHVKNYAVEGYFCGGMGLEVDGYHYIYLLFSQGDIILIDGTNFKQISQYSNDSSIINMIPFNDNEMILAYT